MTTITIVPDGPFSLAAAAGFGFGPNTGRPVYADGRMKLAFVTDDLVNHAVVHLSQDPAGVVSARIESDAQLEVVAAQVRRILSLDHSGTEWMRVGERDAIVGRLQAAHSWIRPVLFHSPYEAAAWSIISARRQRAQGAVIRNRLSIQHGLSHRADGEQVYGFPTPEALLGVLQVQGLDDVRIQRLHTVARAALDGDLEPELLLSKSTDDALAHLQSLPGIGPMYSTLILLRSTGTTDMMTGLEPRLSSYLAHFYSLGHAEATAAEVEAIAENWRPFRTWASVLMRVAGDARRVPFPASTSFTRKVRA